MMKENRWQVYVYRDGTAHKERSCRLLREAQEEAVRCLEGANAVAVYDHQKNRLRKRMGAFPSSFLRRYGPRNRRMAKQCCRI